MILDRWIDSYFAQHQFSWLHGAALFLNGLGKGDALAFLCILLVIAGYFLGKMKWIRLGGAGILTLSASGILVQIAKHITGRARPQQNFGDWHWIGPHLARNGFDSFPSGHAAATFSLAAFFSAYFPKLSWLFYGLALSVSWIGRVTERHHFFSDTIFGAALGIAVGVWGARFFRKWIESESAPVTVDAAPLPPEMPRRRALVLVLYVAGILAATGLSRTALWDRDETEYAQAVLEMQEKKEWLIPTLEGEPFLEKPIFLYWMVRPSVLLFGPTEFGFRLPSAIFMILTAVLVFLLGEALWGVWPGLYAAVIFCSSLLAIGVYHLLLTDPFFNFFACASLLFYVYAYKNPSRRNFFMALSYAAVGFAVLCKGPIGFFPAAVFVAFEIARDRDFKKIPSLGLRHAAFSLIALAIAAPWFIYTHQSQAGAAEKFLLVDNLLRFLKGSEGHTGPMYYFVLVFLLGFFPWSFYAIGYAVREFRSRPGRPLADADALLLSIWTAALFIFFSISAHKLPHYMSPALPAMAALTGRWLALDAGAVAASRAALANLFPAGFLILAPLGLLFYEPDFFSVGLMFPFLVFAVFLFLARRYAERNPRPAVALTAVAVGMLTFCASIFALGAVERARVAEPIGRAIRRNSDIERLYGFHFSEPSLFIYGRRRFPKIETGTVDDLLRQGPGTAVVLDQSALSQAQEPYETVLCKKGFAENSGPMTLCLIRSTARP